jgi:hypothetical protein
MDERGDLYIYDDSTQNEYLYMVFSKDSMYLQYYSDNRYKFESSSKGCEEGSKCISHGLNFYYFNNNVGMITGKDLMWDCWGTLWNPCPPYGGQQDILVYAIIDGEKVYSIEDDSEYLWYIEINTIGVDPTPANLEHIKLHQNYPNPFNPLTIIKYQLSEASQVSLKVYDMLDREVTTLVNSYQNKGSYDVTFNAQGLSSGIYFYKLNANGKQLINKMLLMK